MKKWFYAFFIVGVLAVLLTPLPQLHGSSLLTSAYMTIENAGSALTQRTVLNFASGCTAADDGTNKRTNVTCSGGSGFGGVNEQTSTYTPGSGDAGKLVVMNCSSTCSITLPASPPSSTWAISIISIGSTTATLNLNSLNFNGGASSPTLTVGTLGQVFTDGTNWFGSGFFSASTNVTFTCTVTGCAISSSGGGGGGGSATYGTFASIGTCNSGANGDAFMATDVPIFGVCNGSAWGYQVFGFPAHLPSATSFSWQNQGSATLTTNGIAAMTAPAGGSDNLHGRYVTLPATPYTIDACFVMNSITVNYNNLGLYVSDGTKWVTFQVGLSGATGGGSPNLPEIQGTNWNSATSFNALFFTSQNFNPGAGKYCLRWNDDGTNFNLSTSLDGYNWSLYGSVSRTAFLTPTQIGWYMDANQSILAPVGTLFSWYQH